MLGLGASIPNAALRTANFLLGFATFNGTTDFIDLDFPIQYSTSLTIDFEIKTASTVEFVINGQDAANDGVTIQLDASGNIFFQVNSSTGKITSLSPVNDDDWHRIKCVVTGGTAMELFVDGASQGTDTGTAVSVTTNGRIGDRAFSATSAKFTGSMRRLTIDLD